MIWPISVSYRSRSVERTNNLFVLDALHTPDEPILLRLRCISNHSKLFHDTICHPKLVEIASELVRSTKNPVTFTHGGNPQPTALNDSSEIPLQMYSFVFYSNLYEVDCSEHASPRFVPSSMYPFLKDTLFKMLTEW